MDKIQHRSERSGSLVPSPKAARKESPHSDKGKDGDQHCTLAAVRILTKPVLDVPHPCQLRESLLSPWTVRIPIDPDDYTMRHHWQAQKHTELFASMFDWNPAYAKATSTLSLYFSFGDPQSPFFAPWEDVGKCLKQLLLNGIASHHCAGSDGYLILSLRELDLFAATGPNFPEHEFSKVINQECSEPDHSYYLLRCHYDKPGQQLVFGYHTRHEDTIQRDTLVHGFEIFHHVVCVSLRDHDWRLDTCIVLKNMARILNCVKDYTAPLIWSKTRKLRLVKRWLGDNPAPQPCIEKTYENGLIHPEIQATVGNMIAMYRALEKANVPYTDRLVSLTHDEMQNTTICMFAPVGRAYLPLDWNELLDALLCVTRALVALHDIGIMHRDIRWANVCHILDERDGLSFTQSWILFDFEFAATSPQPPFASRTLTVGNHAPEMMNTASTIDPSSSSSAGDSSAWHNTAVDIWGLGYLMQHASVDIPASHAREMALLQSDCLHEDPAQRPTSTKCLERLECLRARTASHEKDILG